jgi:hypothetical protein
VATPQLAAVVERSFSHQILPGHQTREQGFHVSEFFALHPGRFTLRANAEVRMQGPDMISIGVAVPFMIDQWDQAQ